MSFDITRRIRFADVDPAGIVIEETRLLHKSGGKRAFDLEEGDRAGQAVV